MFITGGLCKTSHSGRKCNLTASHSKVFPCCSQAGNKSALSLFYHGCAIGERTLEAANIILHYCASKIDREK